MESAEREQVTILKESHDENRSTDEGGRVVRLVAKHRDASHIRGKFRNPQSPLNLGMDADAHASDPLAGATRKLQVTLLHWCGFAIDAC
tara:strand:+ start:820 stop:1086 length:267 start_codon:yes stop_codon:yes gene_type:complete